jgi:hypothetical protein
VDEPETSQSAPFTSRTNPTTSRAQFNILPAFVSRLLQEPYLNQNRFFPIPDIKRVVVFCKASSITKKKVENIADSGENRPFFGVQSKKETAASQPD